MKENIMQSSFFEIIDKALVGLKKCKFITENTRNKIIDILQEEIKWN